MRRWAFGLAATTLLFSSAARAEYPVEYTKRPQVVSEKMLQVRGDLYFNLSKDAFFEPVIIAPSVEYGVTDRFQVALRHETSFQFNGGGLTWPGLINGGDFYNGPGLEAKYEFLREDTYSLALFGGPYLNDFDPFLLQARAGIGLWAMPVDHFAVNTSAYVGVGITNRDEGIRVTNPDILVVKVQPSVTPTERLAIFLDLGFYATFQNFSRSWGLPIGIGAFYTVIDKLDIGADFTFPRIIGANDSGGPRYRQVDLLVRYRFDFAK